MHLLPLAADRWRSSLPGAQRRSRYRRDPPGKELFPAGEGVLLRRRHLHRRSAARRGDRPRARQAWSHLVVQRQGQCAACDLGGIARQWATAAPTPSNAPVAPCEPASVVTAPVVISIFRMVLFIESAT